MGKGKDEKKKDSSKETNAERYARMARERGQARESGPRDIVPRVGSRDRVPAEARSVGRASKKTAESPYTLPSIDGVRGPHSLEAIAADRAKGGGGIFGSLQHALNGIRAAATSSGPQAAPVVSAAAGGGSPQSLEELLGLPPIVESDYVAPFDQAAGSAQEAYAAARPAIEQNYTDLDAALKAGAADAQSQFGRNREELLAQLARSRSELDGIGAQQTGLTHVSDPTLMGGAQAEVLARQGALQQTSDSRVALADRFAQIQQQGSQDRMSDAGLAKAAAQSNAATNLQQLLNKIGVERSGAQQQFNQDRAQRSLTLAEESRRMAEEERQRSEDERANTESYLSELKEATVTPAKRWAADTERRVAAQYPRGYAAFLDITTANGAKAAGQAGMTRALENLAKLEQELKADGLNPAKIRQWIEQKYNDWDETVPDEVVAEINARYGR